MTLSRSKKRGDRLRKMREEIASLKAERVLLARLALPQHPKGGFFSPIIAWRVKVVAERILDATEVPNVR